jgi:hypothetical protein
VGIETRQNNQKAKQMGDFVHISDVLGKIMRDLKERRTGNGDVSHKADRKTYSGDHVQICKETPETPRGKERPDDISVSGGPNSPMRPAAEEFCGYERQQTIPFGV